MKNSFLLQDSFLEKINLLEKIKDYYILKKFSIYETHYIFDQFLWNRYYNRKEKDDLKDKLFDVFMMIDEFENFSNENEFVDLLSNILLFLKKI